MKKTRLSPDQQTRLAIAAIAVCDMLTSNIDYESKVLAGYQTRIKGWTNECAKQTSKRIAGNLDMREYAMFVDTLNFHVNTSDMSEDKKKFLAAAFAEICYSFCLDVRNAAPMYGKGKHRRAWWQLVNELNSLARLMEMKHWGCRNLGFGIYEEVAWALENVAMSSPILVENDWPTCYPDYDWRGNKIGAKNDRTAVA